MARQAQRKGKSSPWQQSTYAPKSSGFLIPEFHPACLSPKVLLDLTVPEQNQLDLQYH